MTRKRLLAVLLLGVAVTLTACDADTDPAPTGSPAVTSNRATEGNRPMQTMKRADAEKLAKDLAQQVATTVGKPLTKWRTQPGPCENSAGGFSTDGSWGLSATDSIEVARAEQVATLNKVKDDWSSRGYQITEFHLLSDGDTGGSTSALVPGSGLTISVGSTVSRTGLVIVIATPCYKPADGEDPARGY